MVGAGNSHDLWKGLDQEAVAQSEPIWGLISEPRTLDSTEGKLIFLLSVPPAGRTFPGRASPEKEGQGPLGSKTRALALSSPEWIFMKDAGPCNPSLLFLGGGARASPLPPPLHSPEGAGDSVCRRGCLPPWCFRLNSPCSRSFLRSCFSQIFVFPRSRARSSGPSHWSAEPLAAKLPCSGLELPPHPPWLSAPFSGTGSLITAPWSGDSLQRTEPKHSWGSSRCVISLRSSVPQGTSLIATALHSS